jgi:putative restriction endonuclease
VHGWVGVTDFRWYQRLLDDGLDRGDVNFWQPSARAPKKDMPVGMPFFFKLKAPHNAICGYGQFVRFSVLPDWLAWDSFGRGNGVESLEEFRRRLARLRQRARIPSKVEIGCCMIAEAQVWPEDRWIRQPTDWGPRTVVGATYDLSRGEGLRIWAEAQARSRNAPQQWARDEGPRYGEPTLVRPRLGQGIFRVSVLEAYDRACAVTGEHSLPVLDTAHIQPFAQGGAHDIDNGLSLRVDLHRLFDRGYVTFDEQRRLVVSRRLHEDFENGKTYYAMHGAELRESAEARPDRALAWHREHVFVG